MVFMGNGGGLDYTLIQSIRGGLLKIDYQLPANEGRGSCHKNITVVCMDRNVILIMTQPKSSIKKILFFHHYHYDLSLSITCLNLKLHSHVLLIPLKSYPIRYQN